MYGFLNWLQKYGFYLIGWNVGLGYGRYLKGIEDIAMQDRKD